MRIKSVEKCLKNAKNIPLWHSPLVHRSSIIGQIFLRSSGSHGDNPSYGRGTGTGLGDICRKGNSTLGSALTISVEAGLPMFRLSTGQNLRSSEALGWVIMNDKCSSKPRFMLCKLNTTNPSWSQNQGTWSTQGDLQAQSYRHYHKEIKEYDKEFNKRWWRFEHDTDIHGSCEPFRLHLCQF